MFKVGDMVVYGSSGICEIMEITTMKVDGIPKDKMYYVLSPIKDKVGKIFTPVESSKIKIRKLISKEEALQLIDEMPEIELLGVMNDRMREAAYKECLRNCVCSSCVKVIKTIYLRSKEREANGKKITAMDERYLKIAENSLYSELSVALGRDEEQMEAFIADRIKSKIN